VGGDPVIPLTLAQIAQVTGGQLRGGAAGLGRAVVTGEVVIDSRRAGPGGLFAAVAGERSDGRGFALLGHMAELGEFSPARHTEAGEFAARVLGARLAGLIAVGPEAAPMLAGARQVRSWPGEAVGVPDGAAALAVLGDRLKPGDVVLVKASRAAHLEGVAELLLARGDDPPETRALGAISHPPDPPWPTQEEAAR
jgi:UDP-N-acetylmuramoyl-tripeptide--D-alanyl-D-alanine ligase